ncbi:DNA/RNA non-specific endonuclease [Streptomyces sp. NPDC054802]
MSVEDVAKDVLMEMGMWWPDANSGSLRAAAGHWRDFADAVDDVCHAANRTATTLIHNNKGEAIDAFEVFWGRYHSESDKGWLDDLAKGSRQMAKALEEFADAVDDAIQQLWTQIGIAAATIAAGVGLAVFTFGLSTAASAAAATTIIELAAGLGITVSATVANIAAVTLTGVVFGGIESVTVELAVAQPLKVGTGMQDGLSLAGVDDALKYGAVFGGAFGAAGAGVRVLGEGDGAFRMFGGVPLNVRGPALAVPNGQVPLGPYAPLMRNGPGGGGGRGPMRTPPPYAKPLDSTGRATGVDTTITRSMLDTGTKASRRVKPPGWLGDSAQHTRGHLLARSLGGDGAAHENIAIIYERANNEVMQKLESQIYDTVKAGHDVRYTATPVYADPSDIIPSGIHVTAKGGGLDIDQTIINK